MAIADVVVAAVAIVIVVDCCCLATCICVVCPPLSNGLVQLVCEDGGIVSLLILPQPRPFMRPSGARRKRGCDGDDLAKPSASWAPTWTLLLIHLRSPFGRNVATSSTSFLSTGNVVGRTGSCWLTWCGPPRTRDRDEQRENNGRLGTSGGTRWSRGAQKKPVRAGPTIHLPRRGATCYRAPASWCAPAGRHRVRTHTYTRDRWTHRAGGRA